MASRKLFYHGCKIQLCNQYHLFSLIWHRLCIHFLFYRHHSWIQAGMHLTSAHSKSTHHLAFVHSLRLFILMFPNETNPFSISPQRMVGQIVYFMVWWDRIQLSLCQYLQVTQAHRRRQQFARWKSPVGNPFCVPWSPLGL